MPHTPRPPRTHTHTHRQAAALICPFLKVPPSRAGRGQPRPLRWSECNSVPVTCWRSRPPWVTEYMGWVANSDASNSYGREKPALLNLSCAKISSSSSIIIIIPATFHPALVPPTDKLLIFIPSLCLLISYLFIKTFPPLTGTSARAPFDGFRGEHQEHKGVP